jgi:5-amino-6-(5-phospho-D-ribitylamino)uracil phosphatase
LEECVLPEQAKLPFRLVVIDIDGTLLRRDGTIGERTREAIRAVHETDVVVTLATGRGFQAARPIAEELAIRVPIILHGGALVKDSATGQILHHCHLPVADARAALAIIGQHGCQPIVYENAFAGEGLLCGPSELDSRPTARYLERYRARLRRQPLADLDALIVDDPIQLLVLDRPERVAPLIVDLDSDRWRTVSSVTTVTPGDRLVEVFHPECSKTAAIAHLADLWGFGLANVLAIGDNYNDLDMIQSAGLGVAMGNAPPDVQAVADWITETNQNDGVALSLERFVLDKAR